MLHAVLCSLPKAHKQEVMCVVSVYFTLRVIITLIPISFFPVVLIIFWKIHCSCINILGIFLLRMNDYSPSKEHIVYFLHVNTVRVP